MIHVRGNRDVENHPWALIPRMINPMLIRSVVDRDNMLFTPLKFPEMKIYIDYNSRRVSAIVLVTIVFDL